MVTKEFERKIKLASNNELKRIKYCYLGPVPERLISTNPRLKFCSFFVFYLNFFVLLRVTFCLIWLPYLGAKAQQHFISLSYMFLGKKTLPKIWLNPGLNLTIFRGTGPRCLCLSFYDVSARFKPYNITWPDGLMQVSFAIQTLLLTYYAWVTCGSRRSIKIVRVTFTAICTTWPSFPFTCRSLFIMTTWKSVDSHVFSFIHKNCFALLLSAHFLCWQTVDYLTLMLKQFN